MSGTSDLVPRMKEYFKRQIVLFEEMLAEFSPLEDDWADGNVNRLDGLRQAHAARAARMKEEFRQLLAEWKAATDVSKKDRDAVRLLAERAAGLADQLSQVNERAAQRVGQRLEELRETWGELKRGKGLLRKYAPKRPTEPGFIDRKA